MQLLDTNNKTELKNLLIASLMSEGEFSLSQNNSQSYLVVPFSKEKSYYLSNHIKHHNLKEFVIVEPHREQMKIVLFMCEKITDIKRIGGSERQHEVKIEVVTFEQAHAPPYDLFRITLTDTPDGGINVIYVEREKNLSEQQLKKHCEIKSH